MEKDFDKLNLHDYKPLREIVFESLREAIIDGSLKPGERLMEVQLAEKLGVSRTPVREAIRKLELEGLLIMVPRKGAYVADVSLKDILNVLEVRASLEGLAASLAAERMTEEELQELEMKSYHFNKCVETNNTEGMIEKDAEFHDVIYKSTRNDRLIGIVEGLRDHVQRFRVTYFNEYNKSLNLTKEHQQILEAISERDADLARKLAQDHIDSLSNYMMTSFKAKIKQNKE